MGEIDDDINYVFDVDGTLTPSRVEIDREFKEFFLEWMKDRKVYLLTGSDHVKTVEQVGQDVWKGVTESHQCGGNVVYRKGVKIEASDWEPSKYLLWYCRDLVLSSKYPIKAGNHIEIRTGLLNISVIGRDCTHAERIIYYEWDKINKERKKICKKIMSVFPWLEATAGGQISVDIHYKGQDKSQIRKKITGPIYFFGDKTMEGGNDYPIAKILKEPDKVFQVNDWVETYKILKEIK